MNFEAAEKELLGDRLGVMPPLQRAIADCFNPSIGFEAVPPEEAVALARSVWGNA